MDKLLFAVNLLSAAVIFVHCVCRLTVRRWRFNQAAFWAHGLLIGGAVGVFVIGLSAGHPPPWPEAMVNAGTAAYFTSIFYPRIKRLTWRGWWRFLFKKGSV